MAIQFDSTQVQELVKAHTTYRLSYPNLEKEVNYLVAGNTISLTINGQTLNRTVPVNKRASLRIIYIEEDL